MSRQEVEAFARKSNWTISAGDDFSIVNGASANNLWISSPEADGTLNRATYSLDGGFVSYLRLVTQYQSLDWKIAHTTSELKVKSDGEQMGKIAWFWSVLKRLTQSIFTRSYNRTTE